MKIFKQLWACIKEMAAFYSERWGYLSKWEERRTLVLEVCVLLPPYQASDLLPHIKSMSDKDLILMHKVISAGLYKDPESVIAIHKAIKESALMPEIAIKILLNADAISEVMKKSRVSFNECAKACGVTIKEFNQVLAKLIKPTAKAKKAMEKLGMTLESNTIEIDTETPARDDRLNTPHDYRIQKVLSILSKDKHKEMLPHLINMPLGSLDVVYKLISAGLYETPEQVMQLMRYFRSTPGAFDESLKLYLYMKNEPVPNSPNEMADYLEQAKEACKRNINKCKGTSKQFKEINPKKIEGNYI